MTITLPLQPQEEARLRALAQARGLPPELIVREALDRLLAEEPETPPSPAVETGPDSRPIWEVIVENMKMFPLKLWPPCLGMGPVSMIITPTVGPSARYDG